MSDRFLSIAQIRHIETDAITKHQLNLMDQAGSSVADWVKNNIDKTKKILVLIGRGNNGGDGVIAAIKLKHYGFDVTIFTVATQLNPTTENLIIKFSKLNGNQINKLPAKLDNFDIIIDAMLGIGIGRRVDDKLNQIIELVNQSKKFVLAVDTPTGLDPFSGEVYGNALKADCTITFISDKPGFYTGAGVDLVGKVIVENLVNLDDYTLSRTSSAKILPNDLTSINYSCLARKLNDTNKGSFGTVAIVGGNVGMHGALYLAGRAAMLLGSGKVVLASLDENFATDILMPELMQARPKDVLKNLNEYSVIVVGPGFGRDERALKFLTKLINMKPEAKLIFDADALNLISENMSLHQGFKTIMNKIITPHPGEAGRLLKISTTAVSQNRIKAINNLKAQYNAVTLLKGAGSLIEDNDFIYVNMTGNSALSGAGQGDTLCGIVAAFVAQGLKLSDALRFGVYLHGKAAESLAISIGYNGVLATEIALTARNLLNQRLYT